MRNPSEAVEQHLRQMGIICFAIVSGVVIFWGVVWYLLGSGGFAMAGLAILAMVTAWPRRDQLQNPL